MSKLKKRFWVEIEVFYKNTIKNIDKSNKSKLPTVILYIDSLLKLNIPILSRLEILT